MGININTLSLPEFDWSTDKRKDSLQQLYKAVCSKLDNSIGWYETKRDSKRAFTWILRLGAIIFGLIAAIQPTLAEIFRTVEGELFRPGIATIAALVAGFLLMLDRLFGASSAWMRYMLADLALKELREEFGMTFGLEMAALAEEAAPSLDQTKHVYQAIQGILTRANQILRDETNQWKAEFQSALQQAEELAKVQPRQVQEAVATVRLTNPERLADRQWKLAINNGGDIVERGVSKAIRLTPGPVLLRLTASIRSHDGSTREHMEEKATDLPPGSSAEIPFTLPAE